MSKEAEEELILSDKDESIIEQKPKKKRVLNEKQREAVAINLAKGRAKRDENRKLKQEENLKLKEELIVKKAQQITKKEEKLKNLIGLADDQPDEIEERITKKPKKKKIIYREESESEEEVIIKKKEKKTLPKEAPPPPPVKPSFGIKFI